jgi:hypothetical protein
MARLNPIQYAERLYGAICAANFSPISFLAFGNAVKDGVAMRNMPRIAAEPFMRVVGDMLNLEQEAAADEIVDATISSEPLVGARTAAIDTAPASDGAPGEPKEPAATDSPETGTPPNGTERPRRKR